MTRRLAGLVLVLLLTVLLAACGDDATATPVPTIAAPPATPTPTREPVATSTPTAAPSPVATPTPTRRVVVLATPKPTPTAAARPVVGPTLFFDPDSVTVAPSDEIEVTLVAHPAGKGISGADVVLSYPSDVLTISSIKPGNLLGSDPLVVINRVDNEAGEAQVVLARIGDTGVPTQEGTLLTLRIKVRGTRGTDLTGFHSVAITSAQLSDQSFNLVGGLEVRSLLVTVSVPLRR